MKHQTKFVAGWLALCLLAGCAASGATQVVSGSPEGTEVSQQYPQRDPGPIAQNIPFLESPSPDSLRLDELESGMDVCVRRHDGIYNSDSIARIIATGEIVTISETTLKGQLEVDITPQGYQLVEIAPNQWANAWLTAGTC